MQCRHKCSFWIFRTVLITDGFNGGHTQKKLIKPFISRTRLKKKHLKHTPSLLNCGFIGLKSTSRYVFCVFFFFWVVRPSKGRLFIETTARTYTDTVQICKCQKIVHEDTGEFSQRKYTYASSLTHVGKGNSQPSVGCCLISAMLSFPQCRPHLIVSVAIQ